MGDSIDKEWWTVEELLEDVGKDLEKKELDEARQWVQDNKEELFNNLVIRDITPKKEEDHEF